MKIGENEIKEIIITDKSGELIASITDDDVITHDGYCVKLLEQD